MASTYFQLSLLAVILATLAALAVGLPPFEIRSTDTQSEGSEEWLRHLQKNRDCRVFTEDHPTFLCSSTKTSSEPECILETELCNGKPDCPKGEDESAVLCAALRMVLSQPAKRRMWLR